MNRKSLLFIILLSHVELPAFALDSYDGQVLADHPVMFLSPGSSRTTIEPDLSGNGFSARYLPANSALPKTVLLPDGEPAADFDGATQYLEVTRADPSLSIPLTGELTFEAWIRPDVLQFSHEEESGYVYWLGKGEWTRYEYAGRMYSLTNTEDPPRPNRISGYAWNLPGNLGSGSYFEDPISIGEWIYVAVTFSLRDLAGNDPPGSVSIYKNGVLRQTTPLSQFNVRPQAGGAPLRIATRDFGSYFAGAIGKVAVYGRRLTAERIHAHYAAMIRR